MPDISIRRIYDHGSATKGQSVLVDRLWPRGISHAELGDTPWLKEIAPSEELRHWFRHDSGKWPEFRRRYRAELDANPTAIAILRKMMAQGPPVLLYAARDPHHNNAAVLCEYLLDQPLD